MNRLAVSLALLVLFCVSSFGQNPPQKKGTVCWPIHFAGIGVGFTNDDQLQRLMGGPGVLRPDEGHTGARYYIDPKSEFTLQVELGVDRIIDTMTVVKGIDKSLTPAERKIAISKYFVPSEGFGNWNALHMGSHLNQVLDNLGEPKEKLESGRIWTYESTCSCEIPNTLSIEFRDEKVVKLILSAGD